MVSADIYIYIIRVFMHILGTRQQGVFWVGKGEAQTGVTKRRHTKGVEERETKWIFATHGEANRNIIELD